MNFIKMNLMVISIIMKTMNAIGRKGILHFIPMEQFIHVRRMNIFIVNVREKLTIIR